MFLLVRNKNRSIDSKIYRNVFWGTHSERL